MDAAVEVYCSQCGQAGNPSEMLNLAGTAVCAACKPAFLRKLQEAALPVGALVYRGFWVRLLAKIIDGILIDLVVFALAVPFLLLIRPALQHINVQPGRPLPPAEAVGVVASVLGFYLAMFLIRVGYNTFMLGRFGTTIGKLAINAKVVTPEGLPIGYGRALGRTLMEYVSAFLLLIGYIIAAFDDRKRALHDRVAGTVVVVRQ
ncbi:MAG: RDD family protein [Terriglobales bacterium]